MHSTFPGTFRTRKSFLCNLRIAAPRLMERSAAAVYDPIDQARISVDRMDEVADRWRLRMLQGDRSADMVADVLQSVANLRREKASRSRLQTIRLGLAALTKY
jgi:hypothetical protein